jgi:hypothetical protein
MIGAERGERGTDGVLRCVDAGAPFPILGASQAAAFATLELPVVLDRVAEHAAGPRRPTSTGFETNSPWWPR